MKLDSYVYITMIMVIGSFWLGMLFQQWRDQRIKQKELEESSTEPLLEGKCPACGFEAPMSAEDGQSVLLCDNCEAGFPVYMYVATKTTKPEGDIIERGQY